MNCLIRFNACLFNFEKTMPITSKKNTRRTDRQKERKKKNNSSIETTQVHPIFSCSHICTTYIHMCALNRFNGINKNSISAHLYFSVRGFLSFYFRFIKNEKGEKGKFFFNICSSCCLIWISVCDYYTHSHMYTQWVHSWYLNINMKFSSVSHGYGNVGQLQTGMLVEIFINTL